MDLTTSFNTREVSGSLENKDTFYKDYKLLSHSPQRTAGFEIMPSEHALV